MLNTNILIPFECLLTEDKLYLTRLHSIVFRETSDTSKWFPLLSVWGLGGGFCHLSLISEMRQFSPDLIKDFHQLWTKVRCPC